jgi:hypothetical protein
MLRRLALATEAGDERGEDAGPVVGALLSLAMSRQEGMYLPQREPPRLVIGEAQVVSAYRPQI